MTPMIIEKRADRNHVANRDVLGGDVADFVERMFHEANPDSDLPPCAGCYMIVMVNAILHLIARHDPDDLAELAMQTQNAAAFLNAAGLAGASAADLIHDPEAV